MIVKSENESVLKIKNIYFESIDFKRKEDIDNTKLEVKYQIKVDEKDNDCVVRITTNITSENECVMLSLKTVGIFSIDNTCDYDKETINALKNENTVAIMLPYIRSQISIVSTQPDLSPIVLPIVNVVELIESKS